MAIQALYNVSAHIPSRSQNLSLTISHSNDDEFERHLAIYEENKFVHHTTEVEVLINRIVKIKS